MSEEEQRHIIARLSEENESLRNKVEFLKGAISDLRETIKEMIADVRK